MKRMLGKILLGVCIVCVVGTEGQMAQVNMVDLRVEIEDAMTRGGDDRLILSSRDGLNKYFTGPRLQPSVIARSSSTSSNISEQGLLAAEQLFEYLRAAQNIGGASRYFEFSMDQIRHQIKHFWGTMASWPCHVITTPSGSDAEMLPTLAALLRHDEWSPDANPDRPLVLNIVMASGEVGSGTVSASKLCHFSNLTPVGKVVVAGKQIDGVAAGTIEVAEIKIRDDRGALISADVMEGRLARMLQKAIEELGQKVVLHMVHACKTGFGAPRELFLRDMKQKYQDNLVIVVDAAQLRMSEVAVRAWLDAGFWVLLTGSKFLGGPSFAGAVLIPQDEAALLAAATVDTIPAGLGDYITPADCDEIFGNLQKVLPGWYNLGLALRWTAALAEADRFCNIPFARRDRGVSLWAQGTRGLVKRSKCLKLLDDIVQDDDSGSFNTCIGRCNSVVSFGVQVACAGEYKFLNLVELRKVYELMTLDLNKQLKNLSPELQLVAATSCLIGQPVQIATAGPCTSVLRIAIAVPEIFKAIGHERVDPAVLVDELLYDDQLIVHKLDLIATHWAELSF